MVEGSHLRLTSLFPHGYVRVHNLNKHKVALIIEYSADRPEFVQVEQTLGFYEL